ncbi:MAG TPA: GTPase HflX [Anaerolineales bacterium]|nr:GTPase HflX [Anaerolineales bacterium]
MPRPSIPTRAPRPRAFLFGVDHKDKPALLSLDDSLAELALLAHTAGLEVVGQDTQRLTRADPNTLIRSGKVVELVRWVEELRADVVVFDEELSPRHLRELQEALGEVVQVLDRTALILDIFAQHAHTREGSLQVELAQYEYRLPRLTRAWTHLARQAGGASGRGGTGGVGLRGPGETQLEIDKREISRHITRLKRELEKVRAHRSRYRAQRRRSGTPVVALVGYTNAGKSTLLNALTHAGVYTADQLFATLDPTTRRVRLPGGQNVLLTDTVGFIQKLPTSLVAAFRATLEEIAEADLLLHVVDLTHPNALEQAQAVHETLTEINIPDVPVVTALNKADLLAQPNPVPSLSEHFESAVVVSALRAEGLEALLAAIERHLFKAMLPLRVRLPHENGKLISLYHEHGVVESITHQANGVTINGRLPGYLLGVFRPYEVAARRPARRSAA